MAAFTRHRSQAKSDYASARSRSLLTHTREERDGDRLDGEGGALQYTSMCSRATRTHLVFYY